MVRQRLYGLALGYEDLNDHRAPFAMIPPFKQLFIKRGNLPAARHSVGLKTGQTDLRLLLSMKSL